jgi:hypothetical protein
MEWELHVIARSVVVIAVGWSEKERPQARIISASNRKRIVSTPCGGSDELL